MVDLRLDATADSMYKRIIQGVSGAASDILTGTIARAGDSPSTLSTPRAAFQLDAARVRSRQINYLCPFSRNP